MATYLELFNLRKNSDLQDRVAVAAAKSAQQLLDKATPSQSEIAWAEAALKNPAEKVSQLLNYVLTKNSSLTVAQIQGASDSVLQGQIDVAVDVIVSGA